MFFVGQSLLQSADSADEDKMNLEGIGRAVQSGVSPVCATCELYWEGRERGLPEPQCAIVRPCGSPFAGLTFPEYRGSITDFTQWCFVCGATATKGVKVREEPRIIGMCATHIDMLGNIEPVGLKLNGESVADIIDQKTGRMSQQRFFGPPVKTLGRLIAETEAEFAEEDKARR